MKAMVLSAGLSTRLLPLTETFSKVALPLAGVPVLVRVLRFLRSSGADSFVVNLHHAPESVESCLAGAGEEVAFTREEKLLGTAGGLFGAREHFGQGTFLMVNGDCYYGDCPLKSALEFHRRKGALATLVLTDMPENDTFRGVEIDRGGLVRQIAGLPEQAPPGDRRALHFTGIHVLEPGILAELEPGFSDINRDIYPRLIARGAPVYGYRTAFRWFDLGTPRRFLSAAFDLLARERESTRAPALMVGPNCRIDPSSSLEPPLEIGENSTLGPGCRAARSVLGKGVALARRAAVFECLVGDNVSLGEGAELSRCVVARIGQTLKTRTWEH